MANVTLSGEKSSEPLNKTKTGIIFKKIMRSRQLYLMMLLPVIYFVAFKYIPMLGIQIAFKKYNTVLGIWGSPWVGFRNFIKFFESYQFERVLTNTLALSIYQLIAAFPFPIILALAINNIDNKPYKKIVQMTTYAPHFISTVVMVGVVVQFLSLRLGIVNIILQSFGIKAVDFLGEPGYFRSIYVWSGIWQNSGWGTIIYLAALSGIDVQLYEAATIDGANRWKRCIYIDIPGIMPTAVVLLIMQTGRIMQVGFEKVLLLQTPLNLRTSEVLQTYVYKIGFASNMTDYSYSTAIGLFTSVINFILIITVNRIAKKFGETSLW